VVQCLFTLLGISHSVRRLVSAPTLADQRRLWDSSALIYFLKQGPQLLVWAFKKLCALLLFNRVVLWFGGGVPCKQLKLILEDKVPIEHYIARTMDGVAENSHLRTQNYFYYNCLTGHFTRDNCPSYLKEVRGVECA
jgi:betaine lipid synthase